MNKCSYKNKENLTVDQVKAMTEEAKKMYAGLEKLLEESNLFLGFVKDNKDKFRQK